MPILDTCFLERAYTDMEDLLKLESFHEDQKAGKSLCKQEFENSLHIHLVYPQEIRQVHEASVDGADSAVVPLFDIDRIWKKYRVF